MQRLAKFTYFLTIILTVFAVGGLGFMLGKRSLQTTLTSGELPPSTSAITPIVSKVLVVTYYGGHNPSQTINYDSLIDSVEERMEQASKFRGYNNSGDKQNVDYKIVDRKVITTPPPQEGNNCDQYLPQVQAGQWTRDDWMATSCWGSGTANYYNMLKTSDVCTLRNSDEINEVWFFGFGNAGFWESNMAGPDAYWINGPVFTETSCTKPLVIMGLNYQAGVDFAMHSFGHRMENVFAKFAGESTFAEFYARPSSCGNVHFPPNATKDYDYNNYTKVKTDCENWSPQHSGPKQELNCERWGCSQLGFMNWWFQSIPGAQNGLVRSNGTPMPNIWGHFLLHSSYTGQEDIGGKELFRFWSNTYQTHFYTNSTVEKDSLIATNPNWTYEGVAYKVVAAAIGGICPEGGSNIVYRFWHPANKRHFYTIKKAERDNLIANNPNWTYEGPKYCAYRNAEEVNNLKPVYRFWSDKYQAHFYTINESEKESLERNNPNWKLEGVSLYAKFKN